MLENQLEKFYQGRDRSEERVGDLEAWEEKHGKIPDGAILFLYSGRGKDWANPEKFFLCYGYLHNPGKAKIVSNVCTISLFSSPHVAAPSILFSCYITLGSQVVHNELRGVLLDSQRLEMKKDY